MDDAHEPDRQAQFEELKKLYLQGALSEATFRAAITGLGMDPAEVLPPSPQQVVEHQTQIGEVVGGIAQPDANFHRDVYQAARDTYVIKVDARPGDKGSAGGKTRILDQDTALASYLRHVLESNRRLQLQGIRSAGQLVSIDLEQVYVTLTATDCRTVAEEECWVNEAARLAPGEARRMVCAASDRPRGAAREVKITIQEALAAHPRLVVLGDPGCGKTTLLRYLALTYARSFAGEAGLVKERLGVEERRLPILLPLRDFARHLETGSSDAGLDGPLLLLDYLRKFFINQDIGLPEGFFSDRLKNGGCTVLLDGMDEVADTTMRQRIGRMIDRFTISYPDNRFVVTSRIKGYTERARLNEGYRITRVRDFNRADIELFLTYWNRAVEAAMIGKESDYTRQAAKRKTDDLLAAIDKNERVRELAVNPLLLTVIALVQRYRAELPQRRAELYEEAIEVLLGKWDQAKGLAAKTVMAGRELDAGDQRSLLEPVALWMMAQRVREIEAAELKKQLKGQFSKMTSDLEEAERAAVEFLQLINERSGLLAERGQGTYSFSHLTFQEHLAARAVADRKDYIAYTLGHLGDSWWREVILLQAGYLSTQGKQRVTDLIAAIMGCREEPEPYHNLVLAAECLRDVGQARVAGDIQQKLEERLQAEFQRPLRRAGIMQKVWGALGRRPNQSDAVQRRAAAAEALARIQGGGSGTQPAFWRLPHGEPVWAEVSAGEFWMGEGDQAHRVFLDAFWIARVPVTNTQYRFFVEAGGRKPPSHWEDGRIPAGLEAHPVVHVTWHDALAYCRWLAEVTGKAVTLPTEAQWEKAARGSEDQRVYPWEGDWNANYCNTDELGLGGTTPVGIFPEGVSPCGCLDMVGNVWEWTGTQYKESEYNPDDGRDELGAGDVPRVLRGGSWLNGRNIARCSYRSGNLPLSGDDFSGFRVVVSHIL